jgi:hypothetical protein
VVRSDAIFHSFGNNDFACPFHILFAQKKAVMEQVTVDFKQPLEAPTYRASGFIYGLSEDGSLPEQRLQQDIKIQFIRAGGAQLGCPNGGFVNGQYTQRWTAVKHYYARTKAIGARFILLPHDLWGADAVCNVPRWPGDHGDWSEFTQFMTQVITDAIENGMTGTDVQWDIWNEPDLLTPVIFWGRDQAQYLEMFKRAYQQIREAIPSAVIVGPSTAGQPSQKWEWFNRYLDYTKANQVIPDYLSWHQLVPTSDPQTSKDELDQMISARAITVQGYQVNEYGSNIDEQQAGPSAWYLARFERCGIDALRANWGMGGGLYKGMGDLVTENNQPAPAWWVYKSYAEMTGTTIAVTPGKKVDGTAAWDAQINRSIIVLGSRSGVTGEVSVTVRNIPAHLQRNGKVHVSLECFQEGSTCLNQPLLISAQDIAVSDGSIRLPIEWTLPYGAYAIVFST